MTNNIVEVHNLTKRFGNFTAVDSVSFSIKEGEIVGLLGPNGAGKTTTIHMLLGLITPTAGRIKIFGKEFPLHREEILQKINFSSTYTQMPWRLTVRENLNVVSLLYGIVDGGKKLDTVMTALRLREVEHKLTGELSAGWTTRVNLARIFLNDPRLVLLDEPTSSLDPESAAQIRTEILKLQKKHRTTILWTSHNMAEVEEVCDRVIFLHKGTILAEDTPQGLARRIKTCRVSFMVVDGKKRLLHLVGEGAWKIADQDRFVTVSLGEKEIPVLLSLLNQHAIEYAEITIEKPTLEDFFLSIRKKEIHHEQ